MSKKSAIPDSNRVTDEAAQAVLEALTDSVEQITGRRGSKITTLGGAATTAAIILKINEIINKLQS